MNAGFIISSMLLGVGLAMDAFSVSMANGLNELHMSRRKMAGIAGCFAAFQFLMPMIGWICVHTIATYFKAFQKLIPWIALILLGYIGGKMLNEGIRQKEEAEAEEEVREEGVTRGGLILQGIATSIDALSVGFTIARYDLVMALAASVLIAVVTYFICIGGVLIGRKFGMKLADKASILGGVILILIGIKVFIG